MSQMCKKELEKAMAKTLVVGFGAGKFTLTNAINSSTLGDTISIEPGHYSLKTGVNFQGITIRGAGQSPSDVVITSFFGVLENGYLTLENLTLNELSKDVSTVIISKQASFSATNVQINASGEKVTPIVAQNGNITLTTCTILTREKTFVAVSAIGSEMTIIQCDVSSISVDGSKLDIESSQIQNTLMGNNSNILADSLAYLNTDNQYYTLIMTEKSSFKVSDMVLPTGSVFAHVLDSTVSADQTNIDATHVLTVRQDAAANVQITNAQIVLEEKTINEDNSQSEVPGSKPTNQSSSETDTSVEQTSHPMKTPTKATSEEKTTTPSASDKSQSASAMAQLNAMIGLADVKKEVKHFINVAVFNKKRAEGHQQAISASLHSAFLGNPGTGKTTVARLVAQIMYEEHVLPTDHYVEVSRADLVSQNVGGTAIQTQAVLESALGGVLFIDEAYNLYQEGGSTNWGQEAVDTIMKYMEDHRNELMIIFAGYTKPMQDLLSMNQGLRSRITNWFYFADYTPEEIAEIGSRQLAAQGFTVNDPYYRTAVMKAYKNDINHDNGRWIRTFNEKLLGVVIDAVQADPTRDDSQVLDSDIDRLMGGAEDEKAAKVAALLTELDGLVGQAAVKQTIHDLVDQVQVSQKMGSKLGEEDRPTYHMVFAGDAGTGKTTVARILAQLFYNLGVLPKDTVSEVNRAALIGQYIGETEAKTSKAIRDALGGVLFVDEAYQLTRETGQDFGQNAVETFITELENHRQDFVAIFAGYSQPMQHFLDTNPGLRSRIPYTLEFADYTPTEIAQIVTQIVTKRFTVNTDLLEQIVSTQYTQLPENEKANARWARNFAEQLINRHKLWLVDHLDTDDMKHISDEVVTGMAESK